MDIQHGVSNHHGSERSETPIGVFHLLFQTATKKENSVSGYEESSVKRV